MFDALQWKGIRWVSSQYIVSRFSTHVVKYKYPHSTDGHDQCLRYHYLASYGVGTLECAL